MSQRAIAGVLAQRGREPVEFRFLGYDHDCKGITVLLFGGQSHRISNRQRYGTLITTFACPVGPLVSPNQCRLTGSLTTQGPVPMQLHVEPHGY